MSKPHFQCSFDSSLGYDGIGDQCAKPHSWQRARSMCKGDSRISNCLGCCHIHNPLSVASGRRLNSGQPRCCIRISLHPLFPWLTLSANRAKWSQRFSDFKDYSMAWCEREKKPRRSNPLLEDLQTRVQVRLDGLTVWLSLSEIAALFPRDKRLVGDSKHHLRHYCYHDF